MDPYDTEMQQWCTAAAAKLRRSTAMPESDWPEVDRLVNGFDYIILVTLRSGPTTWFVCTLSTARRLQPVFWAAWQLCDV